jgi:hypothetical protein
MPAMKNRSTTAWVFLLLCFTGCKKGEGPKPAAVPPSPASSAGRAPAFVSKLEAAQADADATKALLTEDKLSRFVTYQKEMLSVTGDAVGVGMQAYAKGGTDQKKFQGAMAADDRSAKIASATKAALEKSGLTQDEMMKLSRVATRYYAQVYAMQDAVGKVEELRKKIDEAKAKGKPPSPVDTAMEKAYSAQADRLEKIREAFAGLYGPQALALIRKHEPEFFAINKRMMDSAMGAMRRKP